MISQQICQVDRIHEMIDDSNPLISDNHDIQRVFSRYQRVEKGDTKEKCDGNKLDSQSRRRKVIVKMLILSSF